MAVSIKASGKRISFMGAVCTPGLMVEGTMASTRTIKSMAREYTRGRTARLTMDSGRMESSTEKPSSPIPKAAPRWASGRTERGSSGSTAPRAPCAEAPVTTATASSAKSKN